MSEKVDLRSMGPGPDLTVKTGPRKRSIDPVFDSKHSRLPRSLLNSSLDKVQDAKVRGLLKRYESKIIDLLDKPCGLILSGDAGAGKSSAAIALGVAGIKSCRSVLRMTHPELQQLQYNTKEESAGSGQLTTDRLKSVDLLILDDFNEPFVTDNTFGPAKLESLIRARNGNLKATFFTTRLTGKEFKSDSALSSLYGVMLETMVAMRIEGKDLRLDKNNALKELLKGE